MEVIPPAISFAVVEASQVGVVRRAAFELGRNLRANEAALSNLGILVTEAANNVWKHGGGGEILLNPVNWQGGSGIELFALDKGRGMADPSKCLEDGFSTFGTPGTGLGAIKRLSDDFDLHSIPDKGTVLYSRLWFDPPRKPLINNSLRVAGFSVPYPGEVVSGDSWLHLTAGFRELFIVADGLGHGLLAAEASGAALDVFKNSITEAPGAILALAHGALKATRGAAVSVLALDKQRRVITYCGIGNIAGCVLSGENRQSSFISQNGTVGMEARRLQEFTYPWPENAKLILASDGLGTRWDLSVFPGLMRRHPAVIAATLYRDFKRGRDDVTVIVAEDNT